MLHVLSVTQGHLRGQKLNWLQNRLIEQRSLYNRHYTHIPAQQCVLVTWFVNFNGNIIVFMAPILVIVVSRINRVTPIIFLLRFILAFSLAIILSGISS